MRRMPTARASRAGPARPLPSRPGSRPRVCAGLVASFPVAAGSPAPRMRHHRPAVEAARLRDLEREAPARLPLRSPRARASQVAAGGRPDAADLAIAGRWNFRSSFSFPTRSTPGWHNAGAASRQCVPQPAPTNASSASSCGCGAISSFAAPARASGSATCAEMQKCVSRSAASAICSREAHPR
jgi:hypothetical protein